MSARFKKCWSCDSIVLLFGGQFLNIMQHKLFSASLLCLVLGATTFAHAQPDPNNAPKGANPPVMAPGMGGADWQKMTPAQKRETIQKTTEQTLRGAMTWLGFADKTLQDTVVASAMLREKTLDEVRDKHRLVAQGLIARQSDAQMEIALDNLRMAQEDAADARVKQIADLDKKIDFSTKPRLKAFLSLVGIISDDSATIGGVLGNTINTMTNMAMGDPAKPEPAAVPAPPAVAPDPAPAEAVQ